MMIKKGKVRKHWFYIWIILIVIILSLYFTHKEWFDLGFLKAYSDDNKLLVTVVYLTVLSLIGLTFLPSTPFAMAGLLFFPPAEAYIINITGIITSTTIVYYFTRFLGLDGWIERRFPRQIQKTKDALSRKELPIIAGWSFFPVVPTDLIIYVSSTLRIPYLKCLFGVLIGEGLLNALYIFSIDFLV